MSRSASFIQEIKHRYDDTFIVWSEFDENTEKTKTETSKAKQTCGCEKLRGIGIKRIHFVFHSTSVMY